MLTEAETGPYKTLIKDVAADFSLSNPDRNWLHRKYLGCSTKRDTYDPDAYSLKLALRQITVERQTQHHTMQLARLDSFDLTAFASQWPTPFLAPSPFMHDANSPILAVHTRVAGFQITERTQDLQRLIVIMESIPKTHHTSSTPSTPLSVPRLIIDLESGPIGARIIYDTDKGEKHHALELRCNGFAVSLDSEYKHPSVAITKTFPQSSSVQSLHWNCNLSIVLEPVLVRVRSKNIVVENEARLTSDNDFLDDPPVLSLGIIEVNVAVNAVAQIDGAAESLAIIDKSTLVYEFSAAFDTICTELWHPSSVDATLQLLSIIPHKAKIPEVKFEPQSQFTRLPAGVSVKIAVARFVVYITSPVISPGENLELSRGFAMVTTISLEYCSLHASHSHWFDDPKRTRSRAKLLLSAEPSVDALVAAKTIVPPNEKSAFVKVQIFNLVSRSAVATLYEPDDPVIVGRDDLVDSHQEFLRINHMHFDLCLSCKVLSPQESLTDICNISVQIPSMRADLELAHVYSVLLGLQTFHILSLPRPPRPVSHVPSKSNNIFMLQGNITTIQIHLTLPNRKLLARIDKLSSSMDSSGPPRIRMAKTAVFVLLPPQLNRWEEPTDSRWDEFVTLQAWEFYPAPHDGLISISLNGNSARMRIPYGFVLADLVQDIIVSAKAIRHISHMASAGNYSAMPSPEPEGPKSVPHITLRLECLCLEVGDDPFESKLALIWQAGAEAVKQRLDREEAFKAKVATIMTTAPDLQAASPKGDGEHEYQFSAKHTVSLEDARKRLDDLHALDWTLRLQMLKEQRSKAEEAIIHKTHSFPPTSLRLPNLTPSPSSPQAPPLLRVTFHNLSLAISPPSFSIDRLPDVMHDLGSGLPRDTKFSLLVPLHVHFTLSSLQISLRDYPVPLLHVPFRGNSRGVSWTFDTDFIIAEEMGSHLTVDWIDCPIIQPWQALHGEVPFSFAVPRTINPVKTYAAPTIEVTTSGPTILSWGVSYGPAIQDMVRVVDTLSSSPRDSSPAVGFWDKVTNFFLILSVL